MIDTLYILIYILSLRALLFFVSKKMKGVINTYFLVVFLIASAFLVPLPIFLIKKEIVMNTVPNILLAGVSLFYFGFVISRMFGGVKRN